MTSLGLALLLPLLVPAGASDAWVGRAFHKGWLPLIDALAEPQGVRVNLHVSGAALAWLETNAPRHLEILAGLVKEGRVEILGGPWAGALLPAVPERDASAQVHEMGRWWRQRAGATPRGAWLPHFAWDPSAPRILGRLGVQYAVVQDSQIAPAPRPDGYVLTEREGSRLALFAVDTKLSSMMATHSPGRVLRGVAARGAEGTRCVVLSMPAESLHPVDGWSLFGPRSWGRRWLAALADASHWLKLVHFSTVLERMPPAGRVYPPPSIGLPPSPSAHGPGWEWTLAAHPEIDRLHKRMLRTSDEVLRLRHALRHAADTDPRLVALDRATRALWDGQVGAAYVVNALHGAQDPGVRQKAWSALLRAEKDVGEALDEHLRPRCEQVDDDCDGQSEIEVRTTDLRAIVAPAHGGALVELDAWALPANLLNVRTRREEAVHAGASDDADPAAHAATESDVTRPHPRGGADWFDRHLRASFADHFLPQDIGPEALVGRWIDAGDFVGRTYQLLHLVDNDDGPLVVGLGREGNVTDGTGLRLVRILKRYAFERERPCVGVRYEVANRFHDTLRTRFGVELNLGIDGLPGTTRLEIDGKRVGVGAPVAHEGPREVALVDAARGVRIVLDVPVVDGAGATLWYAALTTTSLTPAGVDTVPQGVSLLVIWPLDLAPGTRQRLDLSLELR